MRLERPTAHLPETGRLTVPAAARAAPSAALTAAWRAGMVLDAVVISRSAPNLARLDIGGRQVDAQSALPLRTGDRLTLQVTGKGEPIELRVIDRRPPLGRAVASPQLAEALRTTLPRQSDLPAALGRLAASVPALRQDRAAESALGPALRAVLTRVPTPVDVSAPGGLQRALHESGTYLEARLARATANQVSQVLGGDLKAALTRLAAAASATDLPSPPAANPAARAAGPHAAMPGGLPSPDADPLEPTTLREVVEGALARVESRQLSLSTLQQQLAAWQAEIPLRLPDGGHDAIDIHVEQREPDADELESSWSVRISFSPPGLGTLHARLSLARGRVSAWVWAEESESATLLASEIETLDEALRAAGLEVGVLDVRAGDPPRDRQPRLLALPALLDLEA